MGQATYNYNMNTSKQNLITAIAGKTDLSLTLAPQPIDSNGSRNPSKGTPNSDQILVILQITLKVQVIPQLMGQLILAVEIK